MQREIEYAKAKATKDFKAAQKAREEAALAGSIAEGREQSNFNDQVRAVH